MESNSINKVSGFHIGDPKSTNNGEIVIKSESQQQHSPVLQDQLLKLQEFDDLVESLDQNGSHQSKPITNGKISNNSQLVKGSEGDDKDKLSSFAGSFDTSSASDGLEPGLERIEIDPYEGGGLMGLVSMSPANSPIAVRKTRDEPNGITDASIKSTINSSHHGFEDSFTGTAHSPSSNPSGNESNSDLSLFDPHAPVKTPPSSVSKHSWIQFDEDDGISTSSRGTSLSSSSVKYQGIPNTPQSQFSPAVTNRSGIHTSNRSGFVKDWVKYGAQSPRSVPANPHLAAQFTGGSVHSSLYSSELLTDDKSDRQSDITASASALSSHRGSFSGSHDNISHEYMPLESPKNMPAAIPEGWVKFDHSAETSPTKSKIYFVGSAKPGHTRSQSAGGPFANDVFDAEANRRRASSAAVQAPPEEPLSKLPTDSASPPLPLQQQVKENNLHQEQSLFQKQPTLDLSNLPKSTNESSVDTNTVRDKNANNIHLNHPQQLLLHQQHQHVIQKQKLAAVGRQLQQIQEQQLIQTSPVDPQSSPSVDSGISQSPIMGSGNPFKDELLKQQQSPFPVAKASPISEINLTPRSGTSSPFNPFKINNSSSASGDSGIVSTSSTWETFDDKKMHSQLTSSPGNPFKQMIVTANVHPHDEPTSPIYETIKEPGFTNIQTGKSLNSPSHSSVPPTTLINLADKNSDIPQVLNNLTSAATTTTSQSVQFQRQVELKSGARSSGRQPKVAGNDVPGAEFVDEYPREIANPNEGWTLMLRCPDKKKLTSSRYWKPVHVRLIDGNVIQLFDDRTRKEPFRELPLQSNYEFGDRRLQAFDTRGKIHTIKIFYVSYKEKKRISSLETQEKIIHIEPLIKLGSTSYDVFKSFIYCVNEALMKLTAFRDRGRHYEQDMMTITVMDDYRAYIDENGELAKQSVTTDVSVLAFLSGMPACALGLNDFQTKGIEVPQRRDMVPNKLEEWIRMENVNLHKCANKNVFAESRFIEFSPLDGCRFKLLQFKTRPRTRELPMYVKVKVSGEKKHIDMRCDLYIAARTAKQNLHHYICEDIMIRVPLPESWIRYFRKEKRLKGFSSIKAVTKKADSIKSGHKPKLIEVSVGSAKYEHAYKAVVWRIDRLPEKTTNLAITHIMRVQLDLNSTDELPSTFPRNTEVEFTMPHTTASKATVRSLAVATDTSPDKRVRYVAKYDYQVEIEKSFDLPEGKASQCIMQ